MVWCDTNTNVTKWNSEEVIIPYISPVDEQTHRYFVDFVVQIKNNKGELKVYLIEIKPYKFTREPTGKKKTKTFLQESIQFAVNQAKWNAAKQFCKKIGWDFMVITEKDLNR